MGGYDVVALRAICAHYVETNVIPLLSEVQQAQEKVRTQLTEALDALEKKACANATPSLERFERLVIDLSQKASIAHVDDSISQMSEKVPTFEKLDDWLDEAEQKLRNRSLASISQLEERAAKMERTIRSHAAKIEEFREIGQELQCKANVRDVPSLVQFQRLATAVERKANTSKVPTAVQFAELQELVERKVDSSLVPTLSQFEQLNTELAKKCDSGPCTAELRNIHAELQKKPDISACLTEAWVREELEIFETGFRDQVFETLAPVIEKRLASLTAKVQKNSEILDNVMCNNSPHAAQQQPQQQQPTYMCYVPVATCGAWGYVNSSESSPSCSTWQSTNEVSAGGRNGVTQANT
jgi:hypothetical protein